MSRENVEVVRAAHPPSGTDLTQLFADDAEAPTRLEAAASMFHSEFEFSAPTLGGVAFRVAGKGLLELGEAWREWMEPWEVYWTEVEDFIDAGDDQVVVVLRDHGRLRGSEAEVEQLGATVWTLRDRQVARIDFYPTRDHAFEAVGLRE
jgi:hypothetical protein